MLRIFFTLCLLVFCTPLSVLAAEEIVEFTSDIAVNTDGSLSVTETITYDFADNQRHGIFRTLLRQHPQSSGSWYTDRIVDITIGTVERSTNAAPYTVQESARELTLKIGDPDRTITGQHTYTITYTVAGALTYYDGGTVDLYWNVTGDEWEVPIVRSVATVSGAAVTREAVGSCYVGKGGSGAACADARINDAGAVFTADRLEAGSGLTVAQALNPDLVAVQVREAWNLWWVWLIVAAVWLVGLAVYSYRHYYAHHPRRAVMNQYEPYADFKPMFTGVLIDGTLHSRDMTAGILYLAEQGFLRIQKTEHTTLWIFSGSDYQLELLRNPAETETSFQRELLRLLFSDSTEVGSTVDLRTLKQDKTAQKENQKIIQRLKKGVEEDLIARGFYEKAYQPALRQAVVASLSLLVAALLLAAFGIAGREVVFGAAALGIATVIILTVVSTRRTKLGYKARNHLQGFKHFLSMTGTERFAFHDAPEKSPEQFTEYLPYAVAFAVEKEWAEVFADSTIPQPSWYRDGSGSQQFAAASLVSDLDAFSTSFSQSSGSAVSTGGGSAGGGAGGGGGGSW